MCNAHFISCFANSCNLIKFLKHYLNIFVRNFVLCIQIRFVSTEKNYAHRLACILFTSVIYFKFSQKLHIPVTYYGEKNHRTTPPPPHYYKHCTLSAVLHPQRVLFAVNAMSGLWNGMITGI